MTASAGPSTLCEWIRTVSRRRDTFPDDLFMALPPTAGLGRRERQIVELVYQLGQASANDVLERLPDPPSYSTVRKMLALLEDKGYVKHTVDGVRYIYAPTVRQDVARRSALRHLIDTFFDGSEEELVTTLIADRQVSEKRLERLTRLIDDARDREESRKSNGGRAR